MSTPSELNIPICPKCGSKIRPEFKSDFFGYCSWPCLQAVKEEFEAGQVEEKPKAGGLFAKKGVF